MKNNNRIKTILFFLFIEILIMNSCKIFTFSWQKDLEEELTKLNSTELRFYFEKTETSPNALYIAQSKEIGSRCSGSNLYPEAQIKQKFPGYKITSIDFYRIPVYKNGKISKYETKLPDTIITDENNHVILYEVTPDPIDFLVNFEYADDTPYIVEHYFETLDSALSGQSIKDYERNDNFTDKKTGTTNSYTNAQAKTVHGFEPMLFDQQLITPDGQTCINILYNRKLFTIKYNLNGGTGDEIDPVQVPFEGKVIIPDASSYTKENKKFAGWSLTASESDIISENYSVTADITLYMVWKDKPFYQINFDSNGGTNVSPQSVMEDDKAVAPQAPEKSGYDFEYWYTSSSEKYDFNSPVEKDLTLYAKWTPKVYTITYNLDGGTNASENPDVYTIENEVIFQDPVKEGYDFIGWYNSSDVTIENYTEKSANKVTKIAKGSMENKILYALYISNSTESSFEIIFPDYTEPDCEITQPDSTKLEFNATDTFTYYTWFLDGENLAEGTDKNTISLEDKISDYTAGVYELLLLATDEKGIHSAVIYIRIIK